MAFAPYIDPRQFDPQPPKRKRMAAAPSDNIPRAPRPMGMDDEAMTGTQQLYSGSDLLQPNGAVNPGTPYADSVERQAGPPQAPANGATAHAAAQRVNGPPAIDMAALANIDPTNFGGSQAPQAPSPMFQAQQAAPQQFNIQWGSDARNASGQMPEDVNLQAPAGWDYSGHNSFTPPPPLDQSDYSHDIAQLRTPAPPPRAFSDPMEYNASYKTWELQNQAAMGHVPQYAQMADQANNPNLANQFESVMTGVPMQRQPDSRMGEAALMREHRLQQQFDTLPPQVKIQLSAIEQEKRIYATKKAQLENARLTGSTAIDPAQYAQQVQQYDQRIAQLDQQKQQLVGGSEPQASPDQLLQIAAQNGLPPEQAKLVVQQFLQGQ